MRVGVGEHLILGDGGWLTHAIYLGEGEIIASLFNGWTWNPVAQVAIASLFDDRTWARVRRYARPAHAGLAVVARIRSRLGEEVALDRGELCTWAVTGSEYCARQDYVDLPCDVDVAGRT